MSQALSAPQATGCSVSAAFGFPSDWPEVSIDIWRRKYRLMAADGAPIDAAWGDTARRVARAAASVEAPTERKHWAEVFERAINDFEFLPAGRILAGAGARRRVTLFNCFVMGRIEDDLTSIFDHVKEAALTMQQGGGIGHDFSTLRPKGAVVASIGADASGPVTFMDVWDAMCRTIQSAGQRRGAMMATLRCDHPDIETFIDAKREKGRLTNFNLSVLVTDAFVAAVKADAPWDLVFAGKVYRTLQARALWERIMRTTYDVAEPGVIFIDRVNALNGLGYCEQISATNPCGEQPLPAYGACLLGSINLARLISRPFTAEARLDTTRLDDVAAVATRFLDNLVDVSGYPLKAQRDEAKAKRRIGLGVTGLADALIMLGVRYGSKEAQQLTEAWLGGIKIACYRESASLAGTKGAFPLCDVKAILAGPATAGLPDDVRAAIAAHGLRNGLLTSIAPTGTISLLAGNVSSGIEPVFDLAYDRRVLERDGSARTARVEDYAHAEFRRLQGPDARLPAAFVTANALAPRAHLDMQAAAQRQVDSAISKTINCPETITFEAFKDIYLDAHALGLKGVTTYRPNPITGAVLTSAPAVAPSPGGSLPRDVASAASRAAVAALPAVQPVPGLHEASLLEHGSFERGLHEGADVVYMTAPLKRDAVLSGFTYKLSWPASAHALYITINDTEVGGRRRPFEIFINTKTLEHHAWTVALTRMISAVFRRGGDVSFVVEELKAIVDPQGGSWLDGRYVPSLIAAIGGVIETHLRRIGALGEASLEATLRPAAIMQAGDRPSSEPGRALGPSALTSGRAGPGSGLGSPCPRCSSPAYALREGCWVCSTCGHSSCG